MTPHPSNRARGDVPRLQPDPGQPPLQADHLVVGEVLRPHGVRGELRMRILTAYPERLGTLETLYFGPERVPHHLLGVRRHRDALLLRLEGVADRETAGRYRGMLVYVAIGDAVPLGEGEVYLFQLIGLEVITEDGRALGSLTDVLETGANDVYVVEGPHGEVLLPAIPDVIRQVDLSSGRVVVRLLDGLLGDG